MVVLISLGVAGTVTLLLIAGFTLWRSACGPRSLREAHLAHSASHALARPGLVAWPLRMAGGALDRFLSETPRRKLEQWLVRAELDVRFSAAEWLALVLGVTVAVPGVVLAGGVPFGGFAWQVALATLLAAALAPWLWLHDRCKRVGTQVLRDLPGCLDTLTMALEAGCAFGSALQLAVERAADSPLRRALQRCQQEMRAGRGRREALERVALRLGLAPLRAAVAAIVQAEATGVSLAPVIRAMAVRGTRERFSRAEKLAMEAPIRMLAPLVICIFPCTFIVVGFPIAATLFWGG
jgi:tight adherence protein C